MELSQNFQGCHFGVGKHRIVKIVQRRIKRCIRNIFKVVICRRPLKIVKDSNFALTNIESRYAFKAKATH